ncbi:LD-carboxypeptidase [Sporolactobacillus shoreae]|uniref:LD-carboxypeptidase n=1 Tax=Sporolactobacillus shoreae TaxID=1465501 RepID=A0A4Z0GLA1_9BACL|nr:LD-carboxypeptidase [Sporolactobacillus shoreae]TGA96449.1 LD-carboxypeptidase [Sporolactobacillus shoreae]
MILLKKGDTVGLTSCSDGLRPEEEPIVGKVIHTLTSLGLRVKTAETIFQQNDKPFSGSPAHRASELMRFFNDPDVKMIFDLSGGDSANQILPCLDFAAIRTSQAMFTGISDLSVVNNAIFARSEKPSCHYRIKNLAGLFAAEQKKFFEDYIMGEPAPSPFTYRWLRGHDMKGIVIGGNIRCFLKLAGTRFFPDTEGKIIFLEALGGGAARMASLLAQLDQLSVFRKCRGVLLGTFSEMQKKELKPSIEQLVLEITEKYDVPVAKTEQLGHGGDARCILIGSPLSLN